MTQKQANKGASRRAKRLLRADDGVYIGMSDLPPGRFPMADVDAANHMRRSPDDPAAEQAGSNRVRAPLGRRTRGPKINATAIAARARHGIVASEASRVAGTANGVLGERPKRLRPNRRG